MRRWCGSWDFSRLVIKEKVLIFYQQYQGVSMAIVVEIEIIFPIVDDDGYGGRIGSEWVAVAFAATAETNPRGGRTLWGN